MGERCSVSKPVRVRASFWAIWKAGQFGSYPGSSAAERISIPPAASSLFVEV
jgi:hypothetical protein